MSKEKPEESQVAKQRAAQRRASWQHKMPQWVPELKVFTRTGALGGSTSMGAVRWASGCRGRVR